MPFGLPYSFKGQVLASAGSSGFGWGAVAQGGRTEGTGWRWAAKVGALDPRLDLNSTGFVDRNDIWVLQGEVSYLSPNPTRLHRQFMLGLWGAYARDWEGYEVVRRVGVFGHHVLWNTWALEYGYRVKFPDYDDWTTSGRIPVLVPRAHLWYVTLSTDTRRPIVATMHGWFEYRETQGPSWGVELRAKAQLAPLLSVEAHALYKGWRGWLQWVGSDEQDRPIFGQMNFDDLETTLRVELAPRPGLVFQCFGQFVAATGRYDPASYVLLQAPDKPVLLPDQGAVFDLLSLRMNFRIRWQVDPMTTFYVAYTHVAEPEATAPALKWSQAQRAWTQGGDDLLTIKLDRKFWL